MVSKRTLGDIFCDNVEDMTEAQLDVFLVPAADNPKVSVNSLNCGVVNCDSLKKELNQLLT